MRIPAAMSPRFWLRALGAACTGGLLASAYAPFDRAESAWVALVPLLLIARYSRPFAAFRWGFAAGLLFWTVSLSWLLALARTGGPAPLVALGWILLSAYCALYVGAFAMTVSWAWREMIRRRPGAQGALLPAVPLLWVGFEYARGTLFTGFAWNQLGVSQVRTIAIIQMAEWGGVYAVSAMVVVVNTAMAFVLLRFSDVCLRRRRSRFHGELMSALLAWALGIAFGIRAVNRQTSDESEGTVATVAAIQPNVPQLKKWPEDFAAEIYARLDRQTRLAVPQNPDLVVWPETAVPGVVGGERGSEGFMAGLASLGVPLLAGALEEGLVNGESVLWNSAFLFGPDGTIVDSYRKIHLVPFGEYLPFENSIPAIKRMAPLGFSCRPGDRMTVFRVPARSAGAPDAEVAFSTLICFEDTVAALARRAVRKGARLLINQTNDAWFDGTAAARQHMAHTVFRCVENRVPAVRCANTGVTCFIDRVGRVTALDSAEGAQYAQKTDRVAVPPDGARLTAYTRWGDATFALPCGAAAATLFVLVVWREKKESTPGENLPCSPR